MITFVRLDSYFQKSNAMKKLIVAFVLLAVSAVCVNAQDLSKLSKAARAAYNYLKEDGYKPEIDEDNDVVFKAEGTWFYLDNYPKDDTYLKITLPEIFEVDMDNARQKNAALYACNEITRSKKLLRAYMWKDGTVEFSTSTYIPSSGEVDEFVSASIEYMLAAVTSWMEVYSTALE